MPDNEEVKLPANQDSAAPAVKVLLLEDDPYFLEAYRSRLSGAGFAVSVEDDEDEGLELAIQEKPDIIILDISLPKKEDFGFIKELKKEPVVGNTPVVILTDLYSDEDKKRGLSYGAAGYLVRDDLSFNEVINKIKEIVKKN